jgi:hypothetical protein
VLVLTDADRFRFDLDELGEWILKPACDRDRSADGQIIIRKFFARDFAR